MVAGLGVVGRPLQRKLLQRLGVGRDALVVHVLGGLLRPASFAFVPGVKSNGLLNKLLLSLSRSPTVP